MPIAQRICHSESTVAQLLFHYHMIHPDQGNRASSFRNDQDGLIGGGGENRDGSVDELFSINEEIALFRD
ncbi:hypothetical protein E4U54_001769 [Claviceps lovelessii]|nr:hypothetical protein E4U54_001769 [Claviceps lovelessii]